MSQETERRLVTDDEAEVWRKWPAVDFDEGDLDALLDTREALIEALHNIHGILQHEFGDTDPHIRSACDIAWSLLATLRGEAT